ncbi:glycosyl hydrolase family 28-related protein [Bacillus sp. AFS037270]|uniref:glycosyl hydrolase family 28-related protein n=1 Tax=Bacillus sp. AFS037270 TaxID=2033499 RepID=UPI000BFCA6AB|nr:glycosyl hydrolase family 28-related protein [Bacillus sp. AFS037270]PGV52513.1 pectate lyase [Bacillus sp. AFS037270]
MPDLDKTHDPLQNKLLIDQITGNKLHIKELIQETDSLFQQSRHFSNAPQPEASRSFSIIKKLESGVFHLTAERARLLEPTRILLDHDGNVVPDWKDKLDVEYKRLLANIKKEINVVDYGAVGDGKTDCTSAFKKALGNGQVKVIVPPGIYVTKGITLPSWTWFIGSGAGTTTIKLHDKAPKGNRLITNANHWKGNHHLFVQGLSLDWNVERLGNVQKTSTWGNHSSCLTYANVTYGWVKDVEGMNPGLHCFDISSTLYNYAGDGYRARGGSKYVWLDHVTGYGFGDDGITTHHSDYIFISNSHMCDPSGRAHQQGFSNSNGIEIDDGSRNVCLVNNSSSRCFGGIEIKAHENSSAASNVIIMGHISLNDNRSFNFRHIGHHNRNDSESRSAHNIIAANLAAIAPVYSDLYKDSTPRGLVVSAYKNVVVNQFTVVGGPEYDFKGNPVIAVQYRARNVILNRVTVKNFTNRGACIKVYGGDNHADSIKIQDCSPEEIEVGPGVQDVWIETMAPAHGPAGI